MRNTLKIYKLLSCALCLCFGGGALVLTHSATTANAAESLPQKINGAQLYRQYCATCHGKDGRSKTLRGRLTRAENLADPDWQKVKDDDHIYNVISRGKGKMPAFGENLNDAEINALVDHVRTFRPKRKR